MYISTSKNFGKSVLAILSFFYLSCNVCISQTNVSGGIYSNTTWTLAGSPYIVTDTVVVFPGVTLTIQPGVVVKFDSAIEIEIRQGSLIAIGTSSDSISFTSGTSLLPSSYIGVYLNGGTMNSQFAYCNFKYAMSSINSSAGDTLKIDNSYFTNNTTGIEMSGGILSINNCNFRNNIGVGISLASQSIINYCNFLFNRTGLATISSKCISKHCLFRNNTTGIAAEFMYLDSCYITHNQTGISSNSVNIFRNSIIDSNTGTGLSANGDSVVNCNIKYNAIGVETAVSIILGNDIEHNSTSNITDNSGWGASYILGNIIQYSPVGIDKIAEKFTIERNFIGNNFIGIRLLNPNCTISCNSICNNSTYNIDYGAANNTSVSDNYWCLPDSAYIQPTIYDGYQNINYGLVFFTPFDTMACSAILTNDNSISANADEIKLFPNPNGGSFTLSLFNAQSGNNTVEIYNVLGERFYKSIFNPQSSQIKLSNAKKGIYFFRVISENDKILGTGKFVVE